MTAVPRLILIEGMIGSGKTTTAGHLADWLARRGEDARAFDEGAADHPIRTRRVDELLAAPAPGDPEAYSAGQWRRLAEQCLRDEQTIICESIFLQNSVMPAFIDGAPAAAVNQICAEIQRQSDVIGNKAESGRVGYAGGQAREGLWIAGSAATILGGCAA